MAKESIISRGWIEAVDQATNNSRSLLDAGCLTCGGVVARSRKDGHSQRDVLKRIGVQHCVKNKGHSVLLFKYVKKRGWRV